MIRLIMRVAVFVFSGLFFIIMPFNTNTAEGAADESVEAQSLVSKSHATFESFMADEGMAWLHKNIRDARGVLIVPQMLKGGFFLGASGGSGVLLVRDEKTGEWSDPAFYHIGSVSLGLQVGASAAEVVMLVMTKKGADALLATRVKPGGDVSAALGPYGAGMAAKGVTADIVSFARTKGAYLGLSVEGSVIDTADSMNKAYYGKPVVPADILIIHNVTNPKSAELRSALKKAAK